jgi:hypothetical protein
MVDKQCPSCGGFCKSGCERENVRPQRSQTKGEEHMSIEAMKQALRALEKQHNWMVANGGAFAESSKKAIFALEKAIEQAEEQEPVAWIKKEELGYMSAVVGLGGIAWQTNLGLKPEAGDVPLYTAPPKKQWVGLTKTEFEKTIDGLEDLEDCWHAIEAKLKEKNCPSAD